MLLIINAAEASLHFVLARWTPLSLLCSQTWRLPSQGAEILAPALGQALSALRLAPSDLSRIACVRGPGSFSGLRLALVTAAGLARSTSAAQAGLDYLPLIAAQGAEFWPDKESSAADAGRSGGNPGAGDPGADGPCAGGGGLSLTAKNADSASAETMDGDVFWVLTRARKGVVHLQGFARAGSGEGAKLQATGGILALPLEEAARVMAGRRDCPSGRALLLGSGLTENLADWARLRPL
ncbi:MAG: tRNA (adenosine(37)-N6)-threonylcarbamoyltransferase complex dimerization subunit type 1 TsaB, partial [Deltaproteobacteria bacterium]|nr:tRNA (adenosine(37)-N6)-threonylcarbamoyltransferase complex dimerization subunit type 1 TsaB [Deltaproteobacteria bacterium]